MQKIEDIRVETMLNHMYSCTTNWYHSKDSVIIEFRKFGLIDSNAYYSCKDLIRILDEAIVNFRALCDTMSFDAIKKPDCDAIISIIHGPLKTIKDLSALCGQTITIECSLNLPCHDERYDNDLCRTKYSFGYYWSNDTITFV